MSNGVRCCVLQVCCPPPPPGPSPEGSPPPTRVSAKTIEALAKELEPVTGNSLGVATFIFEHYDLVPAGIGTAIVNAYGPEFAKKYGPHT